MKTIIFIILALVISPHLYCQSSVIYGTGTNIYIGAGADVSAETITVNGTFSGEGTFNGGPLPVELVSFSAEIVQNKVELSWKTATELNNYGFEIERSHSSSGKDWKAIGSVKGNINSTSVKEYFFTDVNPLAGVSYYRLKQIDLDGTFEYSGIVEVSIEIPKEFSLSQNYPNPFNPSTIIKYSLPEESKVSISVFNSIGQSISELVNEVRAAGNHEIIFDGSRLSSGIYMCRINVVGLDGLMKFSDARKMILIK